MAFRCLQLVQGQYSHQRIGHAILIANGLIPVALCNEKHDWHVLICILGNYQIMKPVMRQKINFDFLTFCSIQMLPLSVSPLCPIHGVPVGNKLQKHKGSGYKISFLATCARGIGSRSAQSVAC